MRTFKHAVEVPAPTALSTPLQQQEENIAKVGSLKLNGIKAMKGKEIAAMA